MERMIKNILKKYPKKIRLFLRIKNKFVLPIEKIEKYIGKKGKILDIGCGFGLLDIYLAIKSNNRDIMGIDINKKRINLLNNITKDMHNLRFRTGSVTSIDIKNYNTILLIDLLHHIPYDLQKQLIGKCNNLKKNDILIIKEIDKRPRYKFLFNFLTDKIITKNERTYYININNLKQLLNAFSIEEYKINSILYPHILLVCKKK